MHMCAHTRMHVTYAHRHRHTHTHTHINVLAHKYTSAHTCMHAHTHIHTHVHAHMQTKTHEQLCTGVKLTKAVGGSLFQSVYGSSRTALTKHTSRKWVYGHPGE